MPFLWISVPERSVGYHGNDDLAIAMTQEGSTEKTGKSGMLAGAGTQARARTPEITTISSKDAF
jgi:hypothetical protein